jgi:hypothetical protein
MKHHLSPIVVLVLCGSAAGQWGPNLIVNAGADAAAGAPTGYETVVVPGWSPTGTFTAVPWSVGGGFPTAASPGPGDRGVNLFAGGNSLPVATGSQTVSVAAYAAWIDGGSAGYELSGWFGGFLSQEDRAKLSASFLNLSGTVLGTVTIGDVTAAERGLVTGLLYRSATGVVPIGTRSVQLVQTMTRFAGTYNDGYADSLVLRLSSTAVVTSLGTGCGGSPVATLASSAPVLGLSLTIAMSGAAAGATGQLLASAPPAAAAAIGANCFAFIDLATFLIVAPVTTDGSGAWSLGSILPANPFLAGVQVVLQAYVVPGTGPFGLDITNGLLLTLGF